MEKRIFISHSSKDHEVAKGICDALEENGLRCWIAPRDIPYGTQWAGEISKAIEASSAFLFLSSGNSNASEQVSREIQLAIENTIPIIPIRLDDAQYSDANKYYLATIHCMIEYDAAKTHKLVSDIMAALPGDTENKKEKKKSAKAKSVNHILRMLLCVLFAVAVSLGVTYLFFFSSMGDAVKIIVAAAGAVIAFLPLVLCRRKAMKSYNVKKAGVNALFVSAVLLAAGIVTGGYFLDMHLWYEDMDTKYRITISAPSNMTASDFSDAVVSVEERFRVLMKGERYSFEHSGDSVEVILPRSAFAGEDPAEMLKCYISRAMNLSITTNTLKSETDDSYPDMVEVSRNDIIGVEIKHGTVDGCDAKALGIETETYDYIEITLDESFVKKNSDTFRKYGDELVFAQDKAEMGTNYFYHYTYPTEKENVFCIVNDDKLINVNDVLVHNFTTEPLAVSLLVSVDMAVKWESVRDNAAAGKNQCDKDELSENTVTFAFLPLYKDDSDGEWSDTVKVIKERLDVMDEPYAFGHYETDERSIAVRMSTEKAGMYIFELLTAEKLYAVGSFTSTIIPYSVSSPELRLTETDDGCAVEVSAASEDKEKDYAEINRLASETESKTVYLTATGYHIPVLCADAVSGGDGKTIVFDKLAFAGNAPLTKDNMWIAKLIEKVYSTSLPADIVTDGYTFEYENAKESDFGFSIGLEELENKLKTTDEECEVEISGRELKVFFNMPADEKLPENMIKGAKAVFEAVDFENSGIPSLGIYFIEEIDDERARIFFNRTINTLYLGADYYKDGGIYTYGIFSGGRIQRDHDAFIEMVYADEFISKYIDTKNDMPAFS